MWSILRIYSVVYNRSSSLCTSAMSHPSPLIRTIFTDSFHSCNSNSISYNCFYSTSHCRSYCSDHNGYLVREICSTHILASSLLLGDQILMRSIATKSTVMRSICHEINSQDQLSRDQFATKSTQFLQVEKKLLWILIIISTKPAYQHTSNFKEGNVFSRCKFHRLGAKEDLHLLVRLLMSHALNTIVHKIRHQIRQRRWCPPWVRDNTVSDNLHAIKYQTRL